MKYKVIPCLHSRTGEKGWKIVSNDKYDFDYKPNGESFTVYFNYQQALDHCNHLNGKSKVFGQITQDSWDVLRMLFKGWR